MDNDSTLDCTNRNVQDIIDEIDQLLTHKSDNIEIVPCVYVTDSHD